MSEGYRPIMWNRFKRIYDLILWVTAILYLIIFVTCSIYLFPSENINTTLIRAFGTLALLLLHVILVIGPLCRLSGKFLPILYNRRHLGVTMFIAAAVHAILGLLQFHSHGNVNPFISLFISNLHYNSLIFFPFQTLGFLALIILAVMACTSHDFWLHFLGPKFWKALHMLVYVAYGLILLHVALGIIQYEKTPLLVLLLIGGLGLVAGLHLLAAVKELLFDRRHSVTTGEDWKYVCDLAEIKEGMAKITMVNKERVAIFKYDGKLSAVHNVCKHQMGPLGEGKVVDGCITCPWHGYQYRPEDGRAPAPFAEIIATYNLRLIGKGIFVHVHAMPEGTFIEPLKITAEKQVGDPPVFFIGWTKNDKRLSAITKSSIFMVVIFILLLGILLSVSQKRISRFKIDYSQVKKIEGWLSNDPVPSLRIVDGKDGFGNPVFRTILLVDAFKFGADAVVNRALNGQNLRYVRLTGYLSNNIVSCNDSSKDCKEICSQCIMGTAKNPVMEIENGVYSFEQAKAPVLMNRAIENEQTVTFQGEIIDPKCYFGAMNPGEGKPHLSCAARCISGGIMPVLMYTWNGEKKYAVLVGMHGEKINNELLNFVSLPIEIKGKMTTLDDWVVLHVDPGHNIYVLK